MFTFRSKEDIQMANLKKKTRKRTRKFEIDGVIVTTTTSKVLLLLTFDYLIIVIWKKIINLSGYLGRRRKRKSL